METGELNCEKRAVKPRSTITALRRQGRVPAVLYGPGSPPTPVSVSGSELRDRLSAASHTRIVRLKSGASELDGRHVIFKEVQRGPVSGAVLHADLYEVDLKRAIQVEVPLKFTGRALGVADGGILQPLVRAMTTTASPIRTAKWPLSPLSRDRSSRMGVARLTISISSSALAASANNGRPTR